MQIPRKLVPVNTLPPSDCSLDRTGLYFWWFKSLDQLCNNPEILAKLREGKVIRKGRYYLLYVGIAKGQTIRDRIVRRHFRSAHVSTLRFSLGCLLAHGQCLSRNMRQDSGTFAVSSNMNIEMQVTNYICNHAAVSWQVCEDPKCVEATLLRDREYSFPLNIQGNARHPFVNDLKGLRKRYKLR